MKKSLQKSSGFELLDFGFLFVGEKGRKKFKVKG